MRVTAPEPLQSGTFAHSPCASSSPSSCAPASICGKNLRWTAVTLAAKMRRERERLSLHVADEVAADAARETRMVHPTKDCSSVERNTRRRVYDALKVMTAVGCIEKMGKSLRWIGIHNLRRTRASSTDGEQNVHASSFALDDTKDAAVPATPTRSKSAPHNGKGASPQIRRDISHTRTSIASKKKQILELNNRISAFEQIRKKRALEDAPQNRVNRHSLDHQCDLLNKLSFPFILVSGAPVAYSTCSADKKRVRLRFHSPFSLLSETDIVAMLAAQHAKPDKAPNSPLRKSRPTKGRSRRRVNTPTSRPSAHALETDGSESPHSIPAQSPNRSAPSQGANGHSTTPTAKNDLLVTSPTTSVKGNLAQRAPQTQLNEEACAPEGSDSPVAGDRRARSLASTSLAEQPAPGIIDHQELGIPTLVECDTSDAGSSMSDFTSNQTLGRSVPLNQLKTGQATASTGGVK